MPRLKQGADRRRIRGRLAGSAAVLLSLVLLGHELIPDVLGARLAIDSALPWLGLAIPLLLLLAAVARAKTAAALVLVPTLSWLVMFGGAIIPPPPAAAPPGTALTVATQNLAAGNPDPGKTLRELSRRSPDILALEEVVNPIDSAGLSEWPYQVRVGTVMLLSKYPVIDSEPLTLGLGWKRALHATLDSPAGPVSVYVIHADSARLTDHTPRNTMIEDLTRLISHDAAPRIVALGDFNAASYDTTMAGLNSLLTEAKPNSGGFGFTWPREFPLIRLDHILTRGFHDTGLAVQDTTGSDHLALHSTLNAR
ncbi:endonuclease/exonuclease/phosphatase family protein [Arthrobacter sp. 24S4-2]|uniref:endonuclease/exonuclease/phosphatase family protein n=1 Tax=Arthrobacter sp. 24S4-2 TaxID=2575374 RepID=UPI0015866A69|nr:endonuclease/exonuclease/phosphatase family protein [Arthrobacter sp. 24S4-2]